MSETRSAVAKYQSILLETDGPLAILTLNRPQRRNALSLELMTEVIDCLNELAKDRNVRVVLLRAAGKVFSSGHDLSEMVGRDINEYRHDPESDCFQRAAAAHPTAGQPGDIGRFERDVLRQRRR